MQNHGKVTLTKGVPDSLRADVARLFWRRFGHQILPFRVPAGRGEALVRRGLQPRHALIARDRAGALVAVMGLRDAAGGILILHADALQDIFGKRAGLAIWRLMQLYRAGPATADMVIDGLAVADGWRRRGIGTKLIAQGRAEALARGYPGLRAEVELRNHPALRLYRSCGFQPCGTAPMGWPWGRLYGRGRVRILRLAIMRPDPDPDPGRTAR